MTSARLMLKMIRKENLCSCQEGSQSTSEVSTLTLHDPIDQEGSSHRFEQ
jgi:hypothetical protein